ncbi:MAG: hypothetical protein QOH84_5771 [Kribbellaceae bacterium]|jgi:hypothetical protein|nr:hypothetical protein [Kribbellaceae bacterium]
MTFADDEAILSDWMAHNARVGWAARESTERRAVPSRYSKRALLVAPEPIVR